MRKTEQQARFILNNFTVDQIRSGIVIERYQRKGSKTEPVQVRIQGTCTPGYTVQTKWIDENKLSPKAEKLLSAFYQRYQYQRLKAEGAGSKQAMALRKGTPKEVETACKKYADYVTQIYKKKRKTNKKLERYAIVGGMQCSDRELNDWDQYMKETYATGTPARRPTKPVQAPARASKKPVQKKPVQKKPVQKKPVKKQVQKKPVKKPVQKKPVQKKPVKKTVKTLRQAQGPKKPILKRTRIISKRSFRIKRGR